MRPCALVLVGLALVSASGVSIGDSQDEKKSEHIDVLIRQLGDDDFARREAAAKALAEIGEPALKALHKATASGDQEVRQRAERLLQSIVERGTAPQDGGVFVIVNVNSRRCLRVKDGRVVQGAFADAAGLAESWKVVRAGDYFKLVNQNGDQALELPGSAEEPGRQLVVCDNADSLDQLWSFVKVGDHYSIKSRVNGLVVAVDSSIIDENARVIQSQMMGRYGESWRLQWVPGLRDD